MSHPKMSTDRLRTIAQVLSFSLLGGLTFPGVALAICEGPAIAYAPDGHSFDRMTCEGTVSEMVAVLNAHNARQIRVDDDLGLTSFAAEFDLHDPTTLSRAITDSHLGYATTVKDIEGRIMIWLRRVVPTEPRVLTL